MFGKKEEMTLHEAQQHAHRMMRERKAVEFMAGVIDAAVWAEDGVKNADLAVRNSRNELDVLEGLKVQLNVDNLSLRAVQEDMQRQGQALSEKLVVYEKSVEVRMAALDSEYEEKAERLDERYAVLQVQKDELEQQVAALATEKAQIESVVEAFRKANTEAGR